MKELVMFKNYNGLLVLSVLISIVHDLLINLFLGPSPSFSALVGLSFAR